MVGWDRNIDPVAALATDNIKRTAGTVDGLVEHDVVFERVGTDHVIIVGISGSPDEARRAILGTGNGLELCLDEAVPDIGIVLEKQRVSSPTRLLEYLQFRRRRLVMFNRPFWIASAGAGTCPAFGRGANCVSLESGHVVCHGNHLHQARSTPATSMSWHAQLCGIFRNSNHLDKLGPIAS